MAPASTDFARRWRWPAVVLVCFYTFVFRARMALGYWPTYDHPDPKQLHFSLHHSAVWLGLMAMPVMGMVAVVMSVAACFGDLRISWWRVFRPPVFVLGAVFLTIHLDPGGFFGWFAD